MSVLSAMLGSFLAPRMNNTSSIASSTKTVAGHAVELVDELFTTEEEKLDKQAVLARISLKADEWQNKVNAVEARHRSRFVSGWRPFIGWICGMALAWHFLVQPMFVYLSQTMGFSLTPPPVFDLTQLNTILLGMLGLGTLRTAEKAANKA